MSTRNGVIAVSDAFGEVVMQLRYERIRYVSFLIGTRIRLRGGYIHRGVRQMLPRSRSDHLRPPAGPARSAAVETQLERTRAGRAARGDGADHPQRHRATASPGLPRA